MEETNMDLTMRGKILTDSIFMGGQKTASIIWDMTKQVLIKMG